MRVKKTKWRLFWDTSIRNSSTVIITVDDAIALAIFGWFVGLFFLPLLTWFPNHFLPLPPDTLIRNGVNQLTREVENIPIHLDYFSHIYYFFAMLFYNWSHHLFFKQMGPEYMAYLQNLDHQGIIDEIFNRYEIGFYGSWLIAIIGFVIGWKKIDLDEQVRGKRGLTGAQAAADLRNINLAVEQRGKHWWTKLNEWMKSINPIDDMIELAPGVPIARDFWTKHLFMLSKIGAGKTQFLHNLIPQLIKKKHRLFLGDIKGDMVRFYPSARILSPFIKGSLVLDIAKLLPNKLVAETFAEYLIAESKDPMWSKASRALFVGFVVYLNATRRKDWGYKELIQMFKLPGDKLYSLMLKYNPQGASAVEEANVTTKGIQIQMQASLGTLYSLYEAWGDKKPNFDLIEWLENDNPKRSRRRVVMVGDMQYATLTKGFFSAVFSIINSRINSPSYPDSKTRKLWFILDELPQYGKLDINALIEVGRSKDIRFVGIAQSKFQLKKIYGEEDLETWLGSVGIKAFAGLNEGDDAIWLCEKMIGKIEVERGNWSVAHQQQGGSSKTYMESNVKDILLVQPEELNDILGPKDDGVHIGIVGMSKNFNILNIPYTNVATRREIEYEPWINSFIPRASELGDIDLTLGLPQQQQGPDMEVPPEDYQPEWTDEELTGELPPSELDMMAVQTVEPAKSETEPLGDPVDGAVGDVLMSSSHAAHMALPAIEMLEAVTKRPPTSKMKTEIRFKQHS